MSQRFAQLNDFTRQEAQNARTRAFEGNGTAFLMVSSPEEANLLSIDAIRVGIQSLPLVQAREYPVNAIGQRETVSEPMVELQERSDGAQFLVRSVLTNDGIWTAGQTVYITGEWGVFGGAGATPDELSRLESIAERQSPSDAGEAALNALAQGTVAPVVTPVGLVPPPLHPGGPSAGDVMVAEALADLPAEMKAALQKLGEPSAAINASNEQFNAVGITGPAIVRARNALRRALGATVTA